MPHDKWCGNTCAECETPCQLDESMSCSPDCENLRKDGTHNLVECNNAGCNIDQIEVCAFCGAEIDWGSLHGNRGSIWSCEKCGYDFCEACFKEKHGAEALHNMICMDSDERILCSNCYGEEYGRL